MKPKTLIWNPWFTGFAMMLAMFLMLATAFGQNINNTGGTITNNGTLKLKGTWTAIPAAITGTVEYNNGGAQNIPGATYTNLVASGGVADKTLTGGVTVLGNFTVNNGTFKAVLNGQTLNLSGATPLTVTGGSFDFTSGTVNYNGDVDQPVLGTTYQNLGTSSVAAHTKTAGAAVSLTGTLTNAAVTTFDLSTFTFTANTGGVNLAGNAGVLKTSGVGASFLVTAGASIGGTVNYAPPAGSATVGDATYANLTLSGAGTYALNNVSVSGTYSVAGAGARGYGTGTFAYNSPAALQTIVSETNYNILTLTGAGLKQITSGTVQLAGAFTHTAGALTINASGGGLTLGTTASIAGLTVTAGTLTAGSGTATFNNAVSNSGTIAGYTGLLNFTTDLTNNASGVVQLTGTQQAQIAGVLTNAGTLTLAVGSTFTYNGAVQNVVGATYGNLVLTGGAKTITGNATVNGTTTGLTADASSPVTIAGSTTTTLGTGAVATFASNLTTTGSFDANTNAGTTVTFNGAGQTISGTDVTFRALTLSGSSAKISNVNLTVNGAFTPSRGVAMALGKTLTANGTVGAYGLGEEVTGLMMVAAPGASTYTMNNSATQVTFTDADPGRTFTLKNQPLTNPTGTYDAAVQVNRKITASYSTWNTGTATLQLAYKVAEAPSANENKLKYWRIDNLVSSNKVGTGATYGRGTAVDPAFHYLSLALIQPTGGAGSSYTKINSGDVVVMGNNAGAFTTIVASADFNTGSTWDEGSVPTATDDAIINTTGITLAAGANNTINTLTINPSFDLTLTGQGAGPNSGLTVSNGITSSGTLNVNAFRTLTVSAGGYNNQIAASNLSLGAASSIATVTGNLTNAGSISNAGTITVQ